MHAYQRKVLAFLVQQCYEEYLSWGNDEMKIEELYHPERVELTRELLRSWGEEEEYQGPRTEFSITSLCKLAEHWLIDLEEKSEDNKQKPAS